MKRIFYIDVDAFAVAVERIRHPELVGRPMIISTQTAERGVVACASYEARQAGVWPGMPVSLARRRAEGALFLPPNPIECERASRRLFAYLQSRGPVVEFDKADGYFLDMSGCERWMRCAVRNWAEGLARRTLDNTGLPVSVGIASNKLVARIAARVGKPGGIVDVLPGAEADFLGPVSVGVLPGVGRSTRRELREFGIHRVGQLRAMGEETLVRLYGTASGRELWRHAEGLCDKPVVATPAAEMLEFDHAFEEDTSRPTDIDQAAALLVERLIWELRGRDVMACTARLTLVYNDGHHAQRVIRFEVAGAQSAELTETVRTAAGLAFQRRVRVRSLHLTAILHEQREAQFDFFQEQRQKRTGRLHAAIDQVRARHGFSALVMAGASGQTPRVKAARQGSLEDLW